MVEELIPVDPFSADVAPHQPTLVTWLACAAKRVLAGPALVVGQAAAAVVPERVPAPVQQQLAVAGHIVAAEQGIVAAYGPAHPPQCLAVYLYRWHNSPYTLLALRWLLSAWTGNRAVWHHIHR